jgi:hypothetical protein
LGLYPWSVFAHGPGVFFCSMGFGFYVFFFSSSRSKSRAKSSTVPNLSTLAFQMSWISCVVSLTSVLLVHVYRKAKMKITTGPIKK